MDLHNAPDHPALLLDGAVQRMEAESKKDGVSLPDVIALSSASVWFERAANSLLAYETENDVTFAALDNDALKDLREAYDRRTSDSHEDMARYVDLEIAIVNLLGLAD